MKGAQQSTLRRLTGVGEGYAKLTQRVSFHKKGVGREREMLTVGRSDKASLQSFRRITCTEHMARGLRAMPVSWWRQKLITTG